MNSSFKDNEPGQNRWMLATQSIYDDCSHKMALSDHTVHWLPSAAGSQVLTMDLPWASVVLSEHLVLAEVTAVACSPPLKSSQSGYYSILNL